MTAPTLSGEEGITEAGNLSLLEKFKALFMEMSRTRLSELIIFVLSPSATMVASSQLPL